MCIKSCDVYLWLNNTVAIKFAASCITMWCHGMAVWYSGSTETGHSAATGYSEAVGNLNNTVDQWSVDGHQSC